jgi:hypothetical protein
VELAFLFAIAFARVQTRSSKAVSAIFVNHLALKLPKRFLGGPDGASPRRPTIDPTAGQKPAWRRPNEAIGKPDDDAAVHALPNISKAHLSEGAAPARPGGGRDAAVQ